MHQGLACYAYATCTVVAWAQTCAPDRHCWYAVPTSTHSRTNLCLPNCRLQAMVISHLASFTSSLAEGIVQIHADGKRSSFDGLVR